MNNYHSTNDHIPSMSMKEYWRSHTTLHRGVYVMSSFFSNQNTEPCTFHVCLLLFNEQKGTKNNGHSNYEERAQNFSRKCFSQAQRIITKLFFETNNYQTLPIRLASEGETTDSGWSLAATKARCMCTKPVKWVGTDKTTETDPVTSLQNHVVTFQTTSTV